VPCLFPYITVLVVFEFSFPPPLSLYIHIPWCARKCPYCDFNSHVVNNALPERAYIDALLADLEQELPDVWGRTVETIFIGGGTPSLFSPVAIERLVSGVKARLSCKPGLETTLEANPGTLEQGRFRDFHEAGVNRLSIGVQSFNDVLLASIGRIHDAGSAIRAVESARDAGFETFNLDLMFGLPGQSVDQALSDLQLAMDLLPPHLSWYQLTVEPNTLFHQRRPDLPEEDQIWDMQEEGQARLAAHGYTQYEISAYAREGLTCRHNLNYWRYGDYLGIGAGAHAKITFAADQYVRRTWKIKHPHAYLRAAVNEERIGGRSCPEPKNVIFEFLLNALRLNKGFAGQDFEMSTGLRFADLLPMLKGIKAPELLEIDAHGVRASKQGRYYLNDLLAEFLPDDRVSELHYD
jgi:putative oxygen-independent coproporphyrinogen III oxidase